MKKIILAFALGSIAVAAAIASPAHAQTPEEFRTAFQNNLRTNAIQEQVLYGRVEVVVKVVDEDGIKKAVLEQPSSSREFNREVLRAANAALEPTLETTLRMPVSFGNSPAHGQRIANDPRSLGGYLR